MPVPLMLHIVVVLQACLDVFFLVFIPKLALLVTLEHHSLLTSHTVVSEASNV